MHYKALEDLTMQHVQASIIALGLSLLAMKALAVETTVIGPKAHADMVPKSGSKVSGTVDFTSSDAGLQIHYRLKGLAPGKTYGFHIHEKGDCSAPDAASAGAHYIKEAETGGTAADSPAKHAGDLPSLRADKKGEAEGTVIAQNLSVNNANPVLDRAIMLHDGMDNPKKPSKPRIACGEIRQL